MAFQVIVEFTGLCGFVNHPSAQHMRVLLVNARLGGGVVTNPAHAHSPVVEFLLDDYVNSSGLSFDAIDDKGFWFLDNDDLTLGGGSGTFNFNEGSSAGKYPQTSGDKDYTAWIPHMELISTGSGKIKDDFLKGDGAALRQHVAARVLLDTGRLHPGSFTQPDPSGLPSIFHLWDFKKNKTASVKYTQTLAETVELVHASVDPVFTLTAKRFDGSDTRTLVLSDNLKKGGIRVRIKNIELKYVVDDGNRPYPAFYEDFQYFYSLCDSAGDVNVPYRGNLGGTPPGLSRPICPGTVFADNPLA